MNTEHTACITHMDAARLARIVENLLRHAGAPGCGAEALHDALDAASIVPSPDIPPDFVTMNSELVIEDAAGTRQAITLAYPERANAGLGLVSVLSPLGRALLGARAGDCVVVDAPTGTRCIRVVSVVFQPEAAGRFDL